jgi:hypothetical protein
MAVSDAPQSASGPGRNWFDFSATTAQDVIKVTTRSGVWLFSRVGTRHASVDTIFGVMVVSTDPRWYWGDNPLDMAVDRWFTLGKPINVGYQKVQATGDVLQVYLNDELVLPQPTR